MRIFKARDKNLELGGKTYIMGILNVTPDSFSDGGKYYTPATALSHALEMLNSGADIIDIGAASTRPFSKTVDEVEEWERLSAVLPVLRKQTAAPISVDTFNVSVAERALDAGADIINDVGGVYSPEMAALIKKYNAAWVIMHGGVKTAPAEHSTAYPAGIVNHVQMFFDDALSRAAADGLELSQLCLDPGFGFSKDTAQNTELLRGLRLLDCGGAALMSALSRKRFIGELSQDADAADRLGGTVAADIFSAVNGADIIRTHEVELHKKALRTIDRLIYG